MVKCSKCEHQYERPDPKLFINTNVYNRLWFSQFWCPSCGFELGRPSLAETVKSNTTPRGRELTIIS